VAHWPEYHENRVAMKEERCFGRVCSCDVAGVWAIILGGWVRYDRDRVIYFVGWGHSQGGAVSCASRRSPKDAFMFVATCRICAFRAIGTFVIVPCAYRLGHRFRFHASCATSVYEREGTV